MTVLKEAEKQRLFVVYVEDNTVQLTRHTPKICLISNKLGARTRCHGV